MKPVVKAFTALITAYDSSENVDLPATRKQMRRQIGAGNNLFCCGTNGDFSALSFEEKVSIVEAAVDEASGRVKVFANAGCPSTHETLRLCRRFKGAGVDGIALIAPYFIKCTQEGLFRHFQTVANEIEGGIYLYDIPDRTGNPIEVETVVRLAQNENILGIKDTSGNPENLKAYCAIRRERSDFEVYSGPDHLILDGLEMGTSGCVSGIANVIPDLVNGICRQFSAGDIEGSRVFQERVSALRNDLYRLGYPPAFVKRAVYIMSPDVGNNRSPALIPSSEVDESIKAILSEHGIF